MGVSGQHHTPAALYPRRKDSRYPLDRRLGGPQSRSKEILLKCAQITIELHIILNLKNSFHCKVLQLEACVALVRKTVDKIRITLHTVV
jgi:hypothetical protein